MKKVYLETFGCQMNVLDSELVLGALEGRGYQRTGQRDEADVVLFNTCSVRANAEHKVYGRLGELSHLKRKHPEVVVGVLGCMAEREGADLLQRFPQVDLLVGPGELDRVPDLIAASRDGNSGPQQALAGDRARRSSTLDAAGDNLERLDLSRSMDAVQRHGSAYVRITRGCNKFCSYCVVPRTRGAEIHRPPDHIVDECRRLVDAGVVEITLLGQTVNHYRFDHGASIVVAGVVQPQVGPGGGAFTRADSSFNVGRKLTRFSDLLARIHEEIPQLQRLRFVTSFPRDFGDDILQVMADSERICNYLHLPVQSGSDRVLRRMNRGYSVSEYRELVARARALVPGVTIASDFIVGFPGEDESDFQQSMDLVRACGFKNSYVFKYSERPDTPAAGRLADDVPEEVKKSRNHRLLAVQAEVSTAVHRQHLDRTVPVLVEGVSPRGNPEATRTQLSGRTVGDLIVLFEGSTDLVGHIVPVAIHEARQLALHGAVAAPAEGPGTP